MEITFLSKLEKIAFKLTQEHIINLMIFFYIISMYFISYRENLNMISNGIALIFIGMIWINSYIKKRKLVFNKFLLIYLLFIFACFISVFYAINQSLSLIKVRTLILLFILMITLMNYIDTQEKLKKVAEYYAISGFLLGLYVLISSDFVVITRYGEQLGNPNSIGKLVAISSVFCFYFILEKKYIFIPMFITNSVVILLTGSRGSLLFFAITLVIMLFSKRSAETGVKGMMKIIFIGILIILVGYYLINYVPIFHKTIGLRMEKLLSFILGEGTTDNSINLRYSMFKEGIGWFKVKPLTGYGIDNYRILFADIPGGRKTYAHNNIIELLVGIGIPGTFLFYLAYIGVLESLWKASKVISKPLCYSFIAIIVGYFLMSFASVYYYNKHVSIILALGRSIYEWTKMTNKEIIE